jgi:predicted transcriptional regulator of viral defense system
MIFEQFRRNLKAEVFDYQLLAEYLKDLKKPRDKISSLIADGKIVRIKKGLYVFGEQWRNAPLCLEAIANIIYGPSCISFEYALSRYGLIPERSTVITSLTIGDSKTFESPIGVFEYRAIEPDKFKVGIDYKNLGKEGGYFMACKEKALADLVYKTPGIRSIEQLRHYLFEEMRIDETLFRGLNVQKFDEIAKKYRKNSIQMLRKL